MVRTRLFFLNANKFGYFSSKLALEKGTFLNLCFLRCRKGYLFLAVASSF